MSKLVPAQHDFRWSSRSAAAEHGDRREATLHASRHVDDHQLVPQLEGILLTTIMVFPPDPSLVAEIDMRDRTMEVLTELIDLNRILLNLAPSREFPAGSPRHGYDLLRPSTLKDISILSSGRSIGTTAGYDVL